MTIIATICVPVKGKQILTPNYTFLLSHITYKTA